MCERMRERYANNEEEKTKEKRARRASRVRVGGLKKKREECVKDKGKREKVIEKEDKRKKGAACCPPA